MPAAIPLIAGAFLAAGSVATAVGLGTAFIIGATAITWTAVLTVTGVALLGVAMLTQKTMKTGSGSQLQQKLDPQSPLPIVFGRTATGGNIIWRGTWGSKNAMYGIVTALSVGGAIAGIEEYRAGEYPILWSGNPATGTATAAWVGQFPAKSKLYKNKLRQRWQNGQAPASTTPGGASAMPIPIGKLSGVAHVITSYEYNTDAFPQGLPVSLWIIRGNRLYDPRKDSTYPGGSGSHRLNQPSTYEFSENPYLAALQWTLGRWENGKRVYGIGASWSEVDVASFVAGANVADANGWKIGGQITTADDKFAVLSSILASGGGLPIARGAQIAVAVNAPKTSVLTLTRDDVIGEVEIASSTTYRDRQNTIIPRYREETQNWAIISGQRVSSPVYVAEDVNEIKSVEVEYPLVQQAAQAHQLAAYELVNTREFLTFNVQCKMRMLAVRVGDAITVDIAEVAAKGRKCLVVGREYNPADQSVTLSLKSETDAKHAFALGQTQVAPPSPKLDGYDPSDPDAPASTAWSITETQISNGTNTYPVIVVSGAADDPNTRSIVVEYRPLGSSQWLSAGEFPPATKRIEINSVTDQTVYEVAISYRTVLNVVGERLVLTAKAGDLKLAYGNVNGTPTSLGDVNPAEGGKLDGIAPGADVTKDNTSRDTAAVGGVPSGTVIIRVTDVEAAARAAMDRANAVSTTAAETTAKAVIDLTNKINTDVGAAKTEAANALASGIGDVKRSIVELQAGSGIDETARAGVRDVTTAYKAGDKTLADRQIELDTEIGNANSRISSVSPALTTKEEAITKRIDESQSEYRDINSKTNTRITDEISTVSTATGGLARRADALEAALNTPGSGMVAKVNDHENALVNLPNNYVTAGRGNTLEAQMRREVPSNLNTHIDNVNGRIDSVNSTTVTTLNSRIEERAQAWASQEAGAVATRANTLEAQMRREIPSPINSYVDAVNGRIDSVNSTTVSNIAATIEDRASAWARQEAGAVASTVSTLRTEYDRTKGELSNVSSVASDAYGRSRAFLQQTAVAGDNRAQLTLYADSNGGAGVDLIGDLRIGGNLVVDGTITSGKMAPSSVQQIAFQTLTYNISVPRGGAYPGYYDPGTGGGGGGGWYPEMPNQQ